MSEENIDVEEDVGAKDQKKLGEKIPLLYDDLDFNKMIETDPVIASPLPTSTESNIKSNAEQLRLFPSETQFLEKHMQNVEINTRLDHINEPVLKEKSDPLEDDIDLKLKKPIAPEVVENINKMKGALEDLARISLTDKDQEALDKLIEANTKKLMSKKSSFKMDQIKVKESSKTTIASTSPVSNPEPNPTPVSNPDPVQPKRMVNAKTENVSQFVRKLQAEQKHKPETLEVGTMHPFKAYTYLVLLLLINASGLFLPFGVLEWIENHLDGIEFSFKHNMFEYHPFFMITGFLLQGIGMIMS